MSLGFAAITPHPPIIVPNLSKDNAQDVEKTVAAMKKLAEIFDESDIDTVILISPHAEGLSNAMTIFSPKSFNGSLSAFGASEINVRFPGQQDLAKEIFTSTKAAGISVEISADDFELDHGAIVPLYFLTREVGRKINLVEIAFSELSRVDHQEFGRIISKIIDKNSERIAVVASGDLSHRIFDHEYGQDAKEFDETIVNLIKENAIADLALLEEEVVNAAGECGYRSMLILSGVLFERKVEPKVLSYEAPFGVGYLVANFAL
jgi:AmmeMemoRadiSam system protein B